MLKFKIPKLEEFHDQYESIGLPAYHIYSSIYKPVPQTSVTFRNPYLTPEAFGLHVGGTILIGYNTLPDVIEEEDGTLKEEEEDPLTFLPGLTIESIETTLAGEVMTHLSLVGDFEFYQNSDLRVSYKDKYGNEIVEDILNTNDAIKTFERDLQKTDNTTLLYRSLGESDLDFIGQQLKAHYRISCGEPLFYIGLDKVVHFTSINRIIETTTKSHFLLRIKNVEDTPSQEMLDSAIKNYIDEEDYVELHCDYMKMITGGAATKNLKNVTYATDFGFKTSSTAGYVRKPGSQDNMYFPVNKMFMSSVKSTTATTLYNQATADMAYLSNGLYPTPDNLITIKTQVTDFQNLDRLILAGDIVTVLTTYPYSWYNGNYIVSEVEYGYEIESPVDENGKPTETTNAIYLTLIRPNLDLDWSEKLSDNKGSEEFLIPFAPAPEKSNLYKI